MDISKLAKENPQGFFEPPLIVFVAKFIGECKHSLTANSWQPVNQPVIEQILQRAVSYYKGPRLPKRHKE